MTQYSYKTMSDTASNWTSNNPTLLLGEFGYETDTEKLKIGDGTTAWNSLDYWTGTSSGDVVGPASAVNENIAIFDNTTGKLIKDSLINKSAITTNTDKISFDSTSSTKLGTIEESADVTDVANVTAAGALMDSEVDPNIKTLVLPASTTISTFGRTLVDDTTNTAARSTLNVDVAGTDNSDNNATNTQYSGLALSKQDKLTLTTTGTSGVSTLIGATLNIPNYADLVGGQVDSVVAGTGIAVNSTDPINPIVTNSAPNIVQTTITGNAGTVTNGVYTTDFPLNQDTTGTAANATLAANSTAWITMTSLQTKWFSDTTNVLTFDEAELASSITAYGYTTNVGTVTSVSGGTGLSSTEGTTPTISHDSHTGEVTGSTALTITNNIIDEANMKISNAPTNDHVLTADSAVTGGWKWAASSGGFSDPMTTRGDLIFKNASNVTTRLPIGTATYVLTSDGTDASWAAAGGGSGGAAATFERTYTGAIASGRLIPIIIPDELNALDIKEVRLSMLGLPTGSALKVDVRKNGTATTDSIFTSDVEIEVGTTQTATNGVYQSGCNISGSTVGTAGTTIDSARDTLASDDVLWVYITQVGSTIAGADLVVTITVA